MERPNAKQKRNAFGNRNVGGLRRKPDGKPKRRIENASSRRRRIARVCGKKGGFCPKVGS